VSEHKRRAVQAHREVDEAYEGLCHAVYARRGRFEVEAWAERLVLAKLELEHALLDTLREDPRPLAVM
jgi:hypothetical protein